MVKIDQQKSIALASAWYPRGELIRFLNIFPVLEEYYLAFAISLPPNVDRKIIADLEEIGENIHVVCTDDWSWGRYISLEAALDFSSSHVHYIDFDRLLRWVETRPDEWRLAIDFLVQKDCLIMGRTMSAYQTHPMALRRTEEISNIVISYLIGKDMDFSAGSKSFSQHAVEYIIAKCSPGHALGTDAEWPLILHLAGFDIDYIEVNGLDWETPDQHKPHAADIETQLREAKGYDKNPTNWSHRVDVALEIVKQGLNTMQKVKDVKSGK